MVVMPRYNRGSSIRPVHRIKHIVDIQSGTAAGVQAVNDLINAIDAPVLATPVGVETGCTVNGIYLRVEAYANTAAALANIYLAVVKNPGNNLSFGNANALGVDDNKKYVIHQEMVMLEQSAGGNPRTVFNGVIKIPRGYRRFGINDTLKLLLFSVGVDTFFCAQCIFKEFR